MFFLKRRKVLYQGEAQIKETNPFIIFENFDLAFIRFEKFRALNSIRVSSAWRNCMINYVLLHFIREKVTERKNFSCR